MCSALDQHSVIHLAFTRLALAGQYLFEQNDRVSDQQKFRGLVATEQRNATRSHTSSVTDLTDTHHRPSRSALRP